MLTTLCTRVHDGVHADVHGYMSVAAAKCCSRRWKAVTLVSLSYPLVRSFKPFGVVDMSRANSSFDRYSNQ